MTVRPTTLSPVHFAHPRPLAPLARRSGAGPPAGSGPGPAGARLLRRVRPLRTQVATPRRRDRAGKGPALADGIARGHVGLPRQRRPVAEAHVLLPGRGIRTRVSRRPTGTDRRRTWRRRDSPAPRQRHRRQPPAGTDRVRRIVASPARLPATSRRRSAVVRVHPRQLVPGQLTTRRTLLRREQRTGRPPRNRLLRRLHAARRPVAGANDHRQFHLLRHRRPGTSEESRQRRPGPRRPRPAG